MLKDPDVRYVTNSELWAFKRCRRRWWLSHHRQLEPVNFNALGPLAMGTRVHGALQCEYQPGPPRDLLVCYDENWASEKARLIYEGMLDEEMAAVEKEVEFGRIMCEGFVEWREETGVDAGLEIVSVEEALDVATGYEGVRLLGKLDVRGQRKSDGARMFIDHKTCASIEEATWWAPWNRQFLQYQLLERLKAIELGEDLQQLTVGTAVNLVRKVKRTAKAKPPFYARIDVYHSTAELRVYWRQVHAEIKDILQVEDALAAGVDHQDVVYPHPDSTCKWQCQFRTVCPMFDDGSDAEGYLSRYFREYNPNERYNDEDGVNAE